jgi:hypothetical protein
VVRSSSPGRRIAAANDEQELPVRIRKAARSSRAATDRLTTSVEIIRVSGPDAKHLAEIQLEAIKEVLAWALSQRDTTHGNDRHRSHTHDEDRAA